MDKLAHFAVAFLLTGVFASHVGTGTAATLAVIPGTARELVQRQGPEGWRDQGANIAGALAGYVIWQRYGGPSVRKMYPDGAFVWPPPFQGGIVRRLSRCFRRDAGMFYEVRYYLVPRSNFGRVSDGGIVAGLYFRRGRTIALVPFSYEDPLLVEHELRHRLAERGHPKRVFEKECP